MSGTKFSAFSPAATTSQRPMYSISPAAPGTAVRTRQRPEVSS
uniref:Uncharacterized protein n=1 Tax=Arundo donax TaxID=35708 RepID=A0A0A9EJD4_ARUDO